MEASEDSVQVLADCYSSLENREMAGIVTEITHATSRLMATTDDWFRWSQASIDESMANLAVSQMPQ